MGIKAELEEELRETGNILAQMERERANATSGKKSLEIENQTIKKNIDDLERAIAKLELRKLIIEKTCEIRC